MKKTKEKEIAAFNSAEDLINKINERSLNNLDIEMTKNEDFNLVCSKRSRFEIERMAMRNVMKQIESTGLRPSRNHRIDVSNLPNKYRDESGNEKSFSDIKPDEAKENKIPATVTKEIRASGISEIKWSDTRDLPRGQDEDIRKLANAVFSAFNIDENANVMTISSFKNGDLLNKPMELNSVLGFLDKNTISPHEGVLEQDFGKTIDGYAPTIKMYHTPSMAYLVIREPEGMGLEGDYIYAFKRKQEQKLKNEKKPRLTQRP